MSDERSSNLSFHVKESVWFDRGQEVDNLVSIALEPDICIQENKEYVSIVGNLLLTGEYYAPAELESTEMVDSFREEPYMNTADDVRELEEGLFALEHRFPVDITIPVEKISDLNDIYVLVETFDYDILQQNRLQLSADIEISGLIQEEYREDASAELVENETDELPIQEEIVHDEEEKEEPYSAFEFEVRKEDAEEIEEVENEEQREESMVIEVKSRSEEQDDSFYTDEEQEEVFEMDSTIIEEAEEVINERASHEDPEEDKLETVKTHTRDDNALYLTNMLTQENEGFTRVRMRIIQQGDSIDSIAENYSVPVTQILRENRMESGEIQEGQILYIPVPLGRQ
ncbi:stage VI sporulation protein D [Bacillus solimangrovi]|uniref:Stage VI sporulation protein D n=1 Tax=Bacillus solimangrovi TaxID=1305675 RepID=A0A1E5LBH9_9BACI|nr:stage VI sporulation protein D [Bacillus solimangrovi]OEH91440.1 stage VI sporulation protein D [Bacillus solimangrovi]